MSYATIAGRVAGGSATLQAALANPQVVLAAQREGVNLADPAQVSALLASANRLMKPPLQEPVSIGQARSAVRLYGVDAYRMIAALV